MGLAKARDLLMGTSNKDPFDVPIRKSEKLAYRKIREKFAHQQIKVAISQSNWKWLVCKRGNYDAIKLSFQSEGHISFLCGAGGAKK